MLRYISIFMAAAMLFVLTPQPSNAYPPLPGAGPSAWGVQGISGRYINQSNGQPCFVESRDDGYVFTNENGSWAQFVFVGPNQLGQVRGQWNPSVVAAVRRDRLGRVVLRFDSPNAAPGIWVSAAY